METDALRRDPGSDPRNYVLNKDTDSCWVIVDNVSVFIIRDKEQRRVRVELYPFGIEGLCEDPIDFAYANFEEARNIIETEKTK